MAENNLPVYIATDEFLAEIRELGYDDFIELDDFIDFLDEDPSYIEQMKPTIMMLDEHNYVDMKVYKWMFPDLVFPT